MAFRMDIKLSDNICIMCIKNYSQQYRRNLKILCTLLEDIFVMCRSCRGIAGLCGGHKWIVNAIMLCQSMVGIVVVIAWSWLALHDLENIGRDSEGRGMLL
jgi:hypothetical protein